MATPEGIEASVAPHGSRLDIWAQLWIWEADYPNDRRDSCISRLLWSSGWQVAGCGRLRGSGRGGKGWQWRGRVLESVRGFGIMWGLAKHPVAITWRW